MINFHNNKTKRTISVIIIILIVVAMIVPSIASIL